MPYNLAAVGQIKTIVVDVHSNPKNVLENEIADGWIVLVGHDLPNQGHPVAAVFTLVKF